MSFALDVNILLYASDSESPFHVHAKAFVDECLSGGDLFYLGWPTVMGYLRMTTHPAIFSRPLSPEEAMANIESILKLDHVRLLSEETGFWELYREVCKEVPVRGNLVPDAHLAALLRFNGITTLYTHDRDFRKFLFLDVRDPFS